jgi:transketolase
MLDYSHLKLGNLIAIYDDNHISIDGDTAIAFTEDVEQRMHSCMFFLGGFLSIYTCVNLMSSSDGWNTLHVDNGDTDLESIFNSIEAATKVTDKPTLIRLRLATWLALKWWSLTVSF